jgi:hypothetical protein
VSRTPGGLTAGRGRVVLGLGGGRACEGVRGRGRACEGVFYPKPVFSSLVVSVFVLTTDFVSLS